MVSVVHAFNHRRMASAWIMISTRQSSPERRCEWFEDERNRNSRGVRRPHALPDAEKKAKYVAKCAAMWHLQRLLWIGCSVQMLAAFIGYRHQAQVLGIARKTQHSCAPAAGMRCAS